MRSFLEDAGFEDISILIKENAADIISGWMPGSGAEKYVTSAYVTAVKPMRMHGHRDDVFAKPPPPAAAPVAAPVAAPAEAAC
mmetsp:Transcript_18674/g.63084  ORF Transcript_18674/g.63084 Transcript_18674/m.63084 type:complete len:83 (-) Transcript_18674:241-489(-)